VVDMDDPVSDAVAVPNEPARVSAHPGGHRRTMTRSAPQGDGRHPAMRAQRYRVKITIVQAIGLRAADVGLFRPGKSDPYVQGQIEGRPQSMFKTDVIQKTLNPTWDHEHTIDSIKNGDALEFKVFDHDRVPLKAHDLLGEIKVPWSDFFPNGLDSSLKLNNTGNKDSELVLKIEPCPPNPAAKRSTRCFVRIVSATGLMGRDLGGKSDPYCICQVPGKKFSKIQTKVCMATTEPTWMEEDEIDGYAEGDDLEFQVFDWDLVGSNDPLGSALLPAAAFHPPTPPFGFEGTLSLTLPGKGNYSAVLRIGVDVMAPPKVRAKPKDPGQHITTAHRQRVPFRLRSLETEAVHMLSAFTQVGRSRKKLDPEIDLLIDNISHDVSGQHAVIKAWQLSDNNSWHIRVYCRRGGGGFGKGPCSNAVHAPQCAGHAGGGTSVDGEVVDPDIGLQIEPGSVIRFGVNEMWRLEASGLHNRSGAAFVAHGRSLVNEIGDVSAVRELQVPSFACHHALHSCKDWISVVRVSLEWLDDPDEPPCVDCIEVLDELKRTASIHTIATFEEMQSYPIKSMLEDIRLGTTMRLRLCSEPYLLAPVLMYLEDLNRWLEELEDARDDIPE